MVKQNDSNHNSRQAKYAINRIVDRFMTLMENRLLNRSVIFLSDVFISVLSSATLFAFVLSIRPNAFEHLFVLYYLLASLVVSVLTFYAFKIYKGIIRLSGFVEIYRLLWASTIKAFLLAIFAFLIKPVAEYAVVFLVVDLLVTFALLTSLRAIIITIYRARVGIGLTPALFYVNRVGADSGIGSKRYSVYRGKELVVRAFVTRDKLPKDTRIDGMRVYGIQRVEDLDAVVGRICPKVIIFDDVSAFQSFNTELVDYCIDHKIELMVQYPPEAVDRDLAPAAPLLREVRIDDLLAREEITIDMVSIRNEVAGQVVLVTGAAGSIGSELVRQIARLDTKLLLLFDFAESPLHDLRLELQNQYPDLAFVSVIGDIRSSNRLNFLFSTYRPSLIFHAAAYKHVPLMEENPCEAILSIVKGSRQVADCALQYGASKMVMISTDKAVNPSSVMGAAKRIAEMYVQGLDAAVCRGYKSGITRFVTTRFGNVLGSNGSVVPLFQEQIRKGGPITVTHPHIERYFMTIPEACRLVLEAGIESHGGEIFVFDMGDAVKIDTMARRMIRLVGLEPDKDIHIVYTGLRPGEKLYEELLSNQENTIPTEMNKVLLAKVREVDYDEVATMVAKLEDLSEKVLIEDTVRLMKELVPEYHSLNSTYARYEKV